MFDGVVARKCKRTEDEKRFGVELDSLVDVVNFVVLPIVIATAMGLTKWYQVLIFMLYAICGVARLGYFNISIEDSSKPVKYYQGLPVTFIAFLYPIFYLLKLQNYFPFYSLKMVIHFYFFYIFFEWNEIYLN